ncbi:MAG TPA: hypothetical protein VHV10_16535 [Ktedonobacteraceae bacterium]|jgi:hypothetical protein|nr:hypothetical protein [Ktedonobacteraceae bacterium]
MSLQSAQQDIIDAQAALLALGTITPSNFDQARVQIAKWNNAQLEIQKYQNEQFRPDAFSLINQIQSAAANSDKVSVISLFLRKFAEYAATQTQALEPTHPTVKSIVDAMGPMGTGN